MQPQVGRSQSNLYIIMYCGSGNEWQEIGDKVITEGTGVGYTVDVATIGTEVGMLQVVEDHEPKQEECQDDGDGDGEETELLDTVPLS